MNVACPTCGASVEFRYDDSFVRVCGSCRSAVLRTDRSVETLGVLADLVPIESPLQLFAEGKYGTATFLLVGMAQIRHAAGGIWQEWYAKLGGGEWAWVSEAQGRYYVTFERPDTPVPVFQTLAPGAQVTLGDRAYTVGEVGTGTYASATGEIPYRLDPTATFWFADLADGQGGFATIDYNDGTEPPAVYVGRQATLQELGISGGERAASDTGTAAAPRQGGKLACPNCGGSLELNAPDQTLRVACPYCNHLVSVQTGALAVLGKLAHKAQPLIKLGSTGAFPDGELTVIGYLQRSALVDGTWYPFEEYLLYAPRLGFRWLVCSDGHWSYVQPLEAGAVELGPVRYDGVAFEFFMRAHVRVDRVLGEFYWQVKEGERVIAEDYVAPPAMLSCETSPTEQSWSLSTYMTAREVKLALGQRELDMPSPTGVGANQPYPLHGVGRVAALVCGALCLAGIVRCSTADSAVKYVARVDMPPGTFAPPAEGAPAAAETPTNIAFTNKFKLAGGENIEVSMRAPVLDNAWAYIAIDLVNEQTGSVVSFDQNLEHYSGVVDGEAWSEGARGGSQVLGPMDAGDYVMRVETLHGGTVATTLEITLKQDVFRSRYWLFAALALGIPFGIIAIHAFNFRKRRWENSQLALTDESYQPPDEDDDDDD